MKNGTETYYRQKANDVLNYIQNHLSEEINIKYLSERFGISFFHFQRILKAYLNEPLGSYIDRLRLDTAVKLIRYSDTPISEIAYRIQRQFGIIESLQQKIRDISAEIQIQQGDCAEYPC